MQAKTVLVTGGAGFIGSHLVRRLLQTRPDWTIINVDDMTYAGRGRNLEDLAKFPGIDSRYNFAWTNICNKKHMENLFGMYEFDIIFHLAAESHVDRSIDGPEVFTKTNVLGTQILLDQALRTGLAEREGKFVYCSTDEVYGSLDLNSPSSRESDLLRPSSPYSASKAAGDLLVQAYNRTYGLPTVITRCSNNYGTHQFPEKLIPTVIISALAGRPVPVYGDGTNIRDWIHVADHVDGLIHFSNAQSGTIFNLGSQNEIKNLDLVRMILKSLGMPSAPISFVEDRKGHDLRYSINNSHAIMHGWAPRRDFESELDVVVQWYKDNESWWRPLLEMKR